MNIQPDHVPDIAEIRRRLDHLTRALGCWVQRHRAGLSRALDEETAGWLSAGPDEAARMVRRLVRRRRARAEYFPSELFADPAWDILLELTAARLEGAPVPISSLCIAAAVPTTTALRWINALIDLGLVARRSDPTDRRRVFVELTTRGWRAMTAYFSGLAAGRADELEL